MATQAAAQAVRGMMLHQDGSRAEWLASSLPLDLIVTMDDPTSTIYEEERIVARDNTVAYEGLTLQLPDGRARAHYVKARVKAWMNGRESSLPVGEVIRRIAPGAAARKRVTILINCRKRPQKRLLRH